MNRHSFSYLFLLFSSTCLSAQDLSYEDALRITAKVEQEQRYVGALSEHDLHQLPVGIIKQVGSSRYVIAIDSAIFESDKAYVHAYMAVEFPGTGKVIAFGARRVHFNPKGIGGGTDSRLMLLSDHSIPIGPNSRLELRGNGSNYVEWDCNGFVAMQLAGDMLFSRGILEPVNEQEEEVKGHFSIRVEDIHALVVAITLDPFKVKGLSGWTFSVEDAVVDWSSTSDDPDMRFPPGFEGESGLWTGTYLRRVSIALPSELSPVNGEASRVVAHNLLIDDSGLSAWIQAENTIPDLSMSGWKFSVEEIALQLLYNDPVGGHLRGTIELPVMDSGQALAYEAMMQFNPENGECNYSFSASPQGEIAFSVLSAKAELFPTTRISMSRTNGQFLPEAFLNGRIRFENERLTTAQLQIQDVHLIHTAPFLTGGQIAYTGNSQNHAANYPVSIDSIRIGFSNQAPFIEMKLMMNLAESQNNGLSVSTFLRVHSRMQEQKLHYDRVSIGAVNIAANSQAFQLNGTIHFREDDPIYGNGFFGAISLSIPDVLEPGFEASACFGRTDFRYFAIDAAVPVKIPIAASGIVMNRLIGGISNRMQPQRQQIGQVTNLLYANTVASGMSQTYTPDQNAGLTFRAGASLAYLPNEETFNGDAMLDIGFNSNGGLDFVRLVGNAYFMSSIQSRRTSPPPVYGSMVMEYSVPAKSFDASIQAQLNVQQTITGNGICRMYVDPNTWSVCIGRPTQPVVVSIQPFASAQAYFMAGDNLEPMSPPPSQVASLVQNGGLNQMRDVSALSQARGIAAGMRLTGGLYREYGWDFFTVYGSFSFGAGFDMMLIDYGPTAHCSGSLAPVGVNGKIAEGQLFAWMQGGIGAKGEIGNKEFDVVLINGSIAALLQGKVPRPSWVSGGVQVQYQILSLIQGQFQFDFELGQTCTVVVP